MPCVQVGQCLVVRRDNVLWAYKAMLRGSGRQCFVSPQSHDGGPTGISLWAQGIAWWARWAHTSAWGLSGFGEEKVPLPLVRWRWENNNDPRHATQFAMRRAKKHSLRGPLALARTGVALGALAVANGWWAPQVLCRWENWAAALGDSKRPL